MNIISIKSGKEKQLKNHHPWVFSGAIDHVNCTSPCVCKVVDSNSKFIAFGVYEDEKVIFITNAVIIWLLPL